MLGFHEVVTVAKHTVPQKWTNVIRLDTFAYHQYLTLKLQHLSCHDKLVNIISSNTWPFQYKIRVPP